MEQNKIFDIEGILEKVLKRVQSNAERFGNKLPRGTDTNYKYILGNGGSWTDSFWVGMLYLAYGFSKNTEFLRYADGYQDFFRIRVENTEEICKNNNYMPLDHDTGFMFTLSQVARYKLTGEAEAKDISIRAAEMLASRYNEKGRFIRAWDTWIWDTDEEFINEKKGKTIIDSMMNVPLLMWAYGETKNEKYKEIVVSHTNSVMKYFVRDDFSTYHTYNFNADTGEPIKGKTAQGYADHSCWSRGHSWAIYGFALMYGYTKDIRYYDTCLGLIDYFLSKLDDSLIPVWDFSILDKEDIKVRPWDSSAACIAASGILEICKFVQDEQLKQSYLNKVQAIIKNVTSLCGTLDVDNIEPLLLHGCGGPAYKEGTETTIKKGIDTNLIFGDYFYFESLLKLRDPEFELFW